jgi:hypothetical protein
LTGEITEESKKEGKKSKQTCKPEDEEIMKKDDNNDDDDNIKDKHDNKFKENKMMNASQSQNTGRSSSRAGSKNASEKIVISTFMAISSRVSSVETVLSRKPSAILVFWICFKSLLISLSWFDTSANLTSFPAVLGLSCLSCDVIFLHDKHNINAVS